MTEFKKPKDKYNIVVGPIKFSTDEQETLSHYNPLVLTFTIPTDGTYRYIDENGNEVEREHKAGEVIKLVGKGTIH